MPAVSHHLLLLKIPPIYLNFNGVSPSISLGKSIGYFHNISENIYTFFHQLQDTFYRAKPSAIFSFSAMIRLRISWKVVTAECLVIESSKRICLKNLELKTFLLNNMYIHVLSNKIYKMKKSKQKPLKIQ